MQNRAIIGSLLGFVLGGSLLALGCDSDEQARTPGGDDAQAGESAGGSSGTSNASGGKPSSAAGARNEPSEGGQSPVGAAGADPGSPAPEPVYALTTQVFGETETQSYVLLTTSVAADTELSIADAVIEVTGRALATGPDEGGALFVASDSGPTLTRYDLDEQGRLREDKTLSFLPKGISRFGEYGAQFQYVSEDKAYWFDGPTAQIVSFDPGKMKLGESLPLTQLAADGQVLSFTAAPIRRGSELFTFAAWRTGVVVTPRAAVVILDTEDDSVEIVEDTRCGYVRDGALASDGYLYLATEAFGSAAHYLDATNPPACLLRFDPETREFDASFQIELEDLFGGFAGGSLVVGPDDRAFLRVLKPSAIPAGVTNPRVLASAPAWGWYAVTLGDDPEVSELKAPLSSGSVLLFELGGRRFAPLFENAAETTFLELLPEGPAPKASKLPGLVFSAVKLR